MRLRSVALFVALFVIPKPSLAAGYSGIAALHWLQGNSAAPIQVEISRKSEPRPGWEAWTTFAGKVAWPVVALAGLVVFRRPVSMFLELIAKRATEISIGSVGIKLPTLQEAPLDPEVLTFKSADPTLIMEDSTKRTLYKMLREGGRQEFVLVDLGSGNEWISSRLYIFAVMLQRMKGLRCIVFVASSPDTERAFVATTTPDRLRWKLANLQPWLESAFANAYASVTGAAPLPGVRLVESDSGALNPDVAEQVVRQFLVLVSSPLPPVNITDTSWIALGSRREHATWLSRTSVDTELGASVWKDSIVASGDEKGEARALLRCRAPYVAKVRRNQEFVSVVDRMTFLDELVSKIGDKFG